MEVNSGEQQDGPRRESTVEVAPAWGAHKVQGECGRMHVISPAWAVYHGRMNSEGEYVCDCDDGVDE